MKMSFDLAQKLVQTAKQKAEQMGVKVSIAIVDQSGRKVMVAKMDEAGWLTPDIATAKANAATAFRRDGRALFELANSNPALLGGLPTLSKGEFMLVKGSAVFSNAGGIIGAIGISGATADEDQEIADHCKELSVR